MEDYPDVLFVIYPDIEREGVFRVKCVAESGKLFGYKKLFPLAWRGLQDKKLQDVTGVPDALFCHDKGFVVGACSLEGARTLLRLALDT